MNITWKVARVCVTLNEIDECLLWYQSFSHYLVNLLQELNELCVFPVFVDEACFVSLCSRSKLLQASMESNETERTTKAFEREGDFVLLSENSGKLIVIFKNCLQETGGLDGLTRFSEKSGGSELWTQATASKLVLISIARKELEYSIWRDSCL